MKTIMIKMDEHDARVYFSVYAKSQISLLLGKLSPRDRWKYLQHRVRWERRYRKPYPVVEGKIGRYEGFSFIEWEKVDG